MCVYVCMSVCMYVCVCVPLCIILVYFYARYSIMVWNMPIHILQICLWIELRFHYVIVIVPTCEQSKIPWLLTFAFTILIYTYLHTYILTYICCCYFRYSILVWYVLYNFALDRSQHHEVSIQNRWRWLCWRLCLSYKLLFVIFHLLPVMPLMHANVISLSYWTNARFVRCILYIYINIFTSIYIHRYYLLNQIPVYFIFDISIHSTTASWSRGAWSNHAASISCSHCHGFY